MVNPERPKLQLRKSLLGEAVGRSANRTHQDVGLVVLDDGDQVCVVIALPHTDLSEGWGGGGCGLFGGYPRAIIIII